jgi:hypothetical protein
MFMTASASRRDRRQCGSAGCAVSASRSSARRTPDEQVVCAICINIYEIDQEFAPRFCGDGYYRQNPMHDSRQVAMCAPAAISQERLCHYGFLLMLRRGARVSLKPFFFAAPRH